MIKAEFGAQSQAKGLAIMSGWSKGSKSIAVGDGNQVLAICVVLPVS